MIKIGVIGCGKISQVRHFPEYAAHPGAELAGYYDLNYERASRMAEQYGGTAYGTLEELLEDPQIDAVSVCTANNTHAAVTIRALEAGKHVLCEKPMAVTIDECERMVEAARKNNRRLMIGMNQRFAGAHVKAKELISQGAIGEILTFRTAFGHSGPENWSVDAGNGSWFFDRERAVMGVMADLGVHKTDLIQFLTGGCVTEVTARLVTLDKKDPSGNPIAVDDNAFCIYRMNNGITGTMTASWTYCGEEDNSTVLYGTEGIMKIYHSPEHSIEIIARSGGRKVLDIGRIQTNDRQTKSGVIDEFIDALEQNREPSVSGCDVLAAMRAVFAAATSSAEGRAVEILENY